MTATTEYARRYQRSSRGRTNTRGQKRKTLGLFDVDHQSVYLATIGQPPKVMAAIERDMAIDVLDSYGLLTKNIARRLMISQRTVNRRRTARRKTGLDLAKYYIA